MKDVRLGGLWEAKGSPEGALASLFSKLNSSRDLRLMRMQLIDKSVLKTKQNKKQKTKT